MNRPTWIALFSLAVLAVGCSHAPGVGVFRPMLGAARAAIQIPEAPPGAPEWAVPIADAPPAVVATLSTPVLPLDRASVAVQSFKEPNDYAHRNYCGAGASQVLLSAWLSSVPDIEAVAQRNALDPRIGQTGVDTVRGINSWLDAVVRPRLGRSFYQASRVTTLDEFLRILRQDLAGPEARREFGHGAPVMVQAMTPTLPGWNKWNATHMLTIYAYDLRAQDPARDTVSYMETPGSVAGYRGPASQTITVKQLWEAMVAFYTKDKDPINVIW
jgi:hypothetical protein